MIHRIVVDQRGTVHQLDDGREALGGRIRPSADFVREKEERRSEVLPSGADEILAHLVDRPEIGRHKFVQDRLHTVESVLYGMLQHFERGQRGFEHLSPLAAPVVGHRQRTEDAPKIPSAARR
jgi:hypothetical protein